MNTPKGYYGWAKKGDVWSDNGHLSKEGANTLCGLPMLGNNYARELEEAKCPKCLEKLQKL